MSASKLNSRLRKIYDKKNSSSCEIVVDETDPPKPELLKVPPLGVKKELRIDTSHESQESKDTSKSNWRLRKINVKRRQTTKQ